MSEQREALAEALCEALYEYPLGSPELADAVRRVTPAVERVLARLLADERQKGRDEHAAAVKAVLPDECWVTRSSLRCTALIGGTFPNGKEWVEEMCCVPCRLLAALTTGAADRVRAEAQVDFSRLNYGICPKCGEDKCIGHGPWCIDCFTNGASQ